VAECFPRRFVFVLGRARPEFDLGNLRDGRVDVLCASLNSALFRSQSLRKNVAVNVLFAGKIENPSGPNFLQKNDKSAKGLSKISKNQNNEEGMMMTPYEFLWRLGLLRIREKGLEGRREPKIPGWTQFRQKLGKILAKSNRASFSERDPKKEAGQKQDFSNVPDEEDEHDFKTSQEVSRLFTSFLSEDETRFCSSSSPVAIAEEPGIEESGSLPQNVEKLKKNFLVFEQLRTFLNKRQRGLEVLGALVRNIRPDDLSLAQRLGQPASRFQTPRPLVLRNISSSGPHGGPRGRSAEEKGEEQGCRLFKLNYYRFEPFYNLV